MKIVRYGALGAERPGVVDSSGVVHDVSKIIPDWTPEYLQRETLARVAAIDVKELPTVAPGTRLGVPLKGVGKFIGIGMNFSDFALEAGRATPSEPSLFTAIEATVTR